MLGSLTLVPQGLVPCLTHTRQIWEKQGNPRPKALTFLGFTFLIYGRKRLKKIKVFLHRVPGSGDKSVNLLTMLRKIVPLPCLGFQLLRKPPCICFCLRYNDSNFKKREKNHKIFIILIMEIWFSSV